MVNHLNGNNPTATDTEGRCPTKKDRICIQKESEIFNYESNTNP